MGNDKNWRFQEFYYFWINFDQSQFQNYWTQKVIFTKDNFAADEKQVEVEGYPKGLGKVQARRRLIFHKNMFPIQL